MNLYSDISIKSISSGNTIISGYASVFDVPDNQNDIILKGAFASIKTEDVRLLWQHNQKMPIGIVTLLSEDNYGLKLYAEINNKTNIGREASELIKQRAVCGLSIGFSIKSHSYNQKGNRIINDLDLIEVSVVTFPANAQAEIIEVKNHKYREKNNIQNSQIKFKELSKLVKKLKLI